MAAPGPTTDGSTKPAAGWSLGGLTPDGLLRKHYPATSGPAERSCREDARGGGARWTDRRRKAGRPSSDGGSGRSWRGSGARGGGGGGGGGPLARAFRGAARANGAAALAALLGEGHNRAGAPKAIGADGGARR